MSVMTVRRATRVIFAGSLFALLAAGIGTITAASSGASTRASTRSITIGASLPLTGPLGGLGSDQEIGYRAEVNDVNRAGGIKIGGSKYKINLTILNNASTATTASNQARALVTRDGAIALLGGATPTISVPQADVATLLHVPFVTTNNPDDAFGSANAKGWKYAWDVFFKEETQAKTVAKWANVCPSNKKVALFNDTEKDGTFERPLYEAAVKADGDRVVGTYTFPPPTTTFSSFITSAKAAGAQIVIGQMLPTAGIALVKQMKSLGFHPDVVILAKAANAENWWKGLGSLATGSGMELTWSPAAHYPGTPQILKTWGKKLSVDTLASAVPDFGAAQVLLQAISRAGSTSAAKVNAAIAKTNGMFAVGHVKFLKNHTAVTRYLVGQWTHGKVVQVYPPVPGVKTECPMAGLR